MKDYFVVQDVRIPRTPPAGTVWAPSGTKPIDDRFGDFTIGTDSGKEILGSGNTFGPVVAATLADGQEIAIKLFLPLKPEYDRPFLYEYAAHEFRRASLDLGPLFVRAYGLFESQDDQRRAIFFLVMKWVRGPQLDLATNTHPTSAATQVRLTQQMLDALGVLAEHGIVSQDIKPANVMLDSDDIDRANLVLIDHGSTRKIGAGTHVNSQYTEEFAAPETLMSSADSSQHRVFTHASTVFSAGVTLLSAFTMGNPYLEKMNFRTLYATPDLTSSLLVDRVSNTLSGMLARRPEQRASLADLNAVLAGETPDGWHPDPYSSYDELPPTTPDEIQDQLSTQRQFAAIAPEASRLARPAPNPTATEPPFSGAEDMDLVPLVPEETPPADRHWLLEWAGVDSPWVSKPNERKIYGAIGVALIVYFVYVCLGAAAVGWQATESVFVAFIGGLFVGPLLGMALVNLDRTIVASVSPDLTDFTDAGTDQPIKKTRAFWAGMLVRTGVAVVAAFIIGEAINVQLHTGDVNEHLEEQRQTQTTTALGLIDDKYRAPLDELRNAAQTAKDARNDVARKPQDYRDLAQRERDGTGPTGKAGCKSECEIYLALAKGAETTWSTQQVALNQAVTDAENALTTKQSEQLVEQNNKRDEIARTVAGPLARSHALIQKAMSDWLTGVKYIALIILFMAIELSAILIKLLTLNSTYERDMARRLRDHEYASRKATEVRKFHTDEAAALNKKLTSDIVWIQGAERAAAIDRRARSLAQDLGVEAPPGAMTRTR